MPSYTVVLLTDIEAESPGQAVKHAYADIHHGAIFRVYDGELDVRLPEAEAIGDFHADGERAE